jgi:hypothetical protein
VHASQISKIEVSNFNVADHRSRGPLGFCGVARCDEHSVTCSG